MVIDQFHTTYRKDYIWPYVRAYGLKPVQRDTAEGKAALCKCSCPKPDENPLNEAQEVNWTRLAPMGPLLDPKFYPVKVGECPETKVSKFNQPNVFLEKLKQKYPYIYEILKSAPPADMISRINRDRLRTTYQVDYCKLAEYPDAPYEDLVRAAGVGGIDTCVEPIKLPGDPCRPGQRKIAFRPASISKECSAAGGGGGGGGGEGGDEEEGRKKPPCVGTCHGPLGKKTAGATEYQDQISRLGHMIIKDRIHWKCEKK